MSASSPAAKLDSLLIGDGSLLIQCGSLLLGGGHPIACVVTANPAVRDWAEKNRIEVVASGEGLAERLAGKRYDWLFSIANLSLIPSTVWQAAACGAANFHDGPLPRHAGLNAPAWALLQGETRYGVTWHALTEAVDEGDIYVQTTFDIDDEESVLTLNTKCFEAGIASFTELVGHIERGSLQGQPQDLSERTYHARHDRPDAAATLDFAATTADVDRIVRALNFGQGYVNPLGLPKVRTQRGVYFVPALEKADAVTHDPPGTVSASDRDGAVVTTTDGAVRITSLLDGAGAHVDPAIALPAGESVVPLSNVERTALRDFAAAAAKHEAWFARRLKAGHPPEIYGLVPPSNAAAPNVRSLPLPFLSGWDEARAIAAIAGYFIRSGATLPIRLAYVNDTCAADSRNLPGFVAPTLPLVLDVAADVTADALVCAVSAEIARFAERRGYPSDLVLRQPNAQNQPITVAVSSTREASGAPTTANAALSFVVSKTGEAASVAFEFGSSARPGVRDDPCPARSVLCRFPCGWREAHFRTASHVGGRGKCGNSWRQRDGSPVRSHCADPRTNRGASGANAGRNRTRVRESLGHVS